MGWTANLLGLVAEGWDEAHIERLVDAFGALGYPIPDNPRPLLTQMTRGRSGLG